MPIKLWKGLLVLCVEMTFDTDHVLIRGPTMEQIDQRRLFNFAWYRWSYWNDNSSNATSRKCVGNTTGKDDKQHIKRRMQQRIHRLFFDRGKFTTKQSCAINQNFCDRSPLCGCWLFKTLRAVFLMLWHTPRIAMQNSKAANPYPNDCIAMFMFTPLFWPLPPMNSTE